MTRLSAAGEALLLGCDAVVDAMEGELLSGVDARDLDSLRQTLRAIAKAR